MLQIRPQSGLEIDGFILGEKLHTGGFATIWEVTHPLYRTPMVMKVPTILDGYDAPTIVGFEVEQMIMPRLTGPHVPRVFGQGDFSRMAYIVTEKIPGGSMWQHFKRAPLEIDTLIEMAARMAQAVHELHRQHVIHLDLKPDNFLQRPTGEMVLIDFGLSRHDLLPDLLAEEFNIPMGTFPYIAPEQYLRQRGDLRSDLFALGAMIYQLATGRLPFGEPATLKGVRERLWRDPVPPRAIRSEIPEWLQEIILRAMEVDPAKRYQSAAQMIFDLSHPMQVRLTGRAHKLLQDGFWTVWKRKNAMKRIKSFGSAVSTVCQIDRAPILLVAVDLAPDMEPLAQTLLLYVKRMLVVHPDARVACINVIKSARLGLDQSTDEEGNHLHVSRLVALRDWSKGIDLPDERMTFSVLENTEPAAAILEHAQTISADHILMGARGHSATRRFLGSVSARVVSEATASVTVIRLPWQPEDDRSDQPPIQP